MQEHRYALLTTQAPSLFASERLKHAAIALVLAIVIGVTTLLRPLDITLWSMQSKMFDRSIDSDIVYVELDRTDGAGVDERVSRNRQILETLRALESSDAELIVINVPLLRSGSEEVDQALRAELTRNKGRIFLTKTVRSDSDRYRISTQNDQYFEQGMPVVSNDYYSDFLGYVWIMPPSFERGSTTLPSIWSILDMRGETADRYVAPDYTLAVSSIRQFATREVYEPAIAPVRTGDKVIIGSEATVRVPNEGETSSGLMHAVAAVTYAQGRGVVLDWYSLLAFVCAALSACALLSKPSATRWRGYALLAASLPVTIMCCAYFALRVGFSETIVFFAIYAIQRIAARYKRRHLLTDPRSRLPNFIALRRDLGGDDIRADLAIIVAKVTRLDSVFTTLSPYEQARYLRQIAGRLSLGGSGRAIYYDGGKYFAFSLDLAQFDDLEGHLRGLRAIATQAIGVGDRMFDVSITIGVDQSTEKTVSNRLSSAIAAADQAREAYRPVFIISDLQDEDWDHSLQSRLEQALSQDRIDIALQPQIDLGSGAIVAAEALARWYDREQGQIAPDRFISHCERVGRLDELTERVLSKTIDAAEDLKNRGLTPEISFNVSAIQFVDSGIADLIERHIVPRDIDPQRLTIELTETARIENFATARATIERIKQLGARFSIDDFGIESANLQTIYELPFDEIKIDRLFVKNLRNSAKSRAIVGSLVTLARDSGLVSIAEGVEDNATITLLREMGCERAQGYFISRPLPLSEFAGHLISRRKLGEWSRLHG